MAFYLWPLWKKRMMFHHQLRRVSDPDIGQKAEHSFVAITAVLPIWKGFVTSLISRLSLPVSMGAETHLPEEWREIQPGLLFSSPANLHVERLCRTNVTCAYLQPTKAEREFQLHTNLIHWSLIHRIIFKPADFYTAVLNTEKYNQNKDIKLHSF